MNQSTSEPPADWNANVYHRVSTPQVTWGQEVFDRLPLAGHETVIDAGCGTGILTAQLLDRLPNGHVIAIDRSPAMLEQAAAYLSPRFGNRVSFVQADVADLSVDHPVDAIISTATFHWVRDHQRLFRHLYAALRPGGRIIAQCGGGPNILRLREHAETVFAAGRYRERGIPWPNPWEFASPDLTATRLIEAGFVEVATGLQGKPTTFGSAGDFKEFVEHVVLREHLPALPDDAARADFMNALTRLAGADDPPYTLDYWRLNFSARRPNAR